MEIHLAKKAEFSYSLTFDLAGTIQCMKFQNFKALKQTN